jgi:hypothetical protein
LQCAKIANIDGVPMQVAILWQVHRARAPRLAVHLIPARQQELDEIRAILPTGSGYQSAARHILYNVPLKFSNAIAKPAQQSRKPSLNG